MITEDEQLKIKEILGHYYSDLVSEELNKKGIRNKFGLPHSDNMIRQVMNGNRSHVEIEQAIFSAVEYQNKQIEKEQKKREKLLKTKTVAATTV